MLDLTKRCTPGSEPKVRPLSNFSVRANVSVAAPDGGFYPEDSPQNQRRRALIGADARFSLWTDLIRRAIRFQLNPAHSIVENAELRRGRRRHIDDAAVTKRSSAADPHRDRSAGVERGDLDQRAEWQRPVCRDQLA